MTFPQRFRHLFVICALPVHLWAALVYFYDLPGLMLRMSMPDFLAHGAYVFAFALFESMVLTLALALLTLRLRPKKFPALDAVLLVCGLWLIGIRTLPIVAQFLQEHLPPGIVLFAFDALLVGILVGFVGALLGIRRFFRHRPGVTVRMRGLHERLSVLVGAYLFFDVLSVIYILLRNL